MALFNERYLPSNATQTRFAPIHTLYHSPDLIQVQDLVINDIRRRSIKFPNYSSLRLPLCSPVSGSWISSSSASSSSLAEEIVAMTLLHPVNFDAVIDKVPRELCSAGVASVKLTNVGPGNALSRTVARSLSPIRVESIDWSSVAIDAIPDSPPRVSQADREDIAIVGMAVKFPGANDSAGLWDVLEQGLNTVSEVRTYGSS